jgi:nicotinamidase-related amidase
LKVPFPIRGGSIAVSTEEERPKRGADVGKPHAPLRTWDVTDPTQPKILCTYQLEEQAQPYHGVDGVQSLVICGESTSDCVRASAVDAYSNGFHVVLVEECCFDRSVLSHKVNLFDLHHKYADVMHVGEVIAHLDALAEKKVKKAS